MRELKTLAHEGSHWLMGKLFGRRVDGYLYIEDDKVPSAIIWYHVPMRWQRLLILAAPMFMLPLWLVDRGYNGMEFLEELYESEGSAGVREKYAVLYLP